MFHVYIMFVSCLYHILCFHHKVTIIKRTFGEGGSVKINIGDKGGSEMVKSGRTYFLNDPYLDKVC